MRRCANVCARGSAGRPCTTSVCDALGEWRARIIEDGATPSVVNHATAALSAALGQTVKHRRIPANPCLMLEPVPEVVDRPAS